MTNNQAREKVDEGQCQGQTCITHVVFVFIVIVVVPRFRLSSACTGRNAGQGVHSDGTVLARFRKRSAKV